MDECEFESLPVPITHLRDSLGFFYQHVAETNRPLVIQRYREQSVVMVPLWEWRWLKQLEANVRAGKPIITEKEINAISRDVF
jgi:aryl-alcohol dehydrogenase-like predicted oxidoreductase